MPWVRLLPWYFSAPLPLSEHLGRSSRGHVLLMLVARYEYEDKQPGSQRVAPTTALSTTNSSPAGRPGEGLLDHLKVDRREACDDRLVQAMLVVHKPSRLIS